MTNFKCELNQLRIPSKYVKETERNNVFLVAVHKLWLKSLLNLNEVQEFLHHETLSADEVQALLQQGGNFGLTFDRILINVFPKEQKKAIPLPRARTLSSTSQSDLSFCQLLHYVSQTNHKNLWKEAFKKYLYSTIPSDTKHVQPFGFISFDSVMRDIITRTYGCPVIRLEGNTGSTPTDGRSKVYETHSNILPALCAIETNKSFFIIHYPCPVHTLQDCVTFSPAVLGTSHVKQLFIIYQLLQTMRMMHDRGMILGNISLSDVYVSEDMWIQVIPQFMDNIHLEIRNGCETASSRNSIYREQSQVSGVRSCDNHHSENIPTEHSFLNLNRCDVEFGGCELKRSCELWIRGQISNFEYLMVLNRCAGRRYGDPTCHYVIPWVTDFSSRNGLNWRDLSKSQFRLNKGDRQLDLTYDTALGGAQVPHHISDVLSEITYYVYLARCTSRQILCKYVRTKWVPAEYPSSIQRLQEWTPDECIPEFFTDPSVFKSIHEDLPDLEVPPWATSPEDFIYQHREILESIHVSERLHHWIDLTFGYKLSGSSAVKAKNVCLQLVDNHTTLANTGVVQLFTQPHPQRQLPSPFWGKLPPKLQSSPREKRKTDRVSEDEGHSSGFEEEDTITSTTQSTTRSSSVGLTRLLSRSRSSLLTPITSVSTDETSSKDKLLEQQKSSSTTFNTPSAPSITLPKEYNPAGALQAFESQYGFLNKMFYQAPELEWYGSMGKNKSNTYMQLVASRRIREMQILGCLVVELLLASRLRALTNCDPLSFEQRLEACLCVLSHSKDMIPWSVKYALSLLLQIDLTESEDTDIAEDIKRASLHPFRYPTVTSLGLPPPSAHQLLQPLLSSIIFPFPQHFAKMFKMLETFHEYDLMFNEVNFLFLSSSTDNQEYTENGVLQKKNSLISKIAECKVNTAAKELAIILPEISSTSFENVEVLLPYIKKLLETPSTAIPAAWHLFDLVSKVLGPKETSDHLLDHIVKLYDYGSNVGNCDLGRKHVKLYHRSFLLQLIVRLGLKTFLENFIVPLVEAVGGYRDWEYGNTSHCRGTASHLTLFEIIRVTILITDKIVSTENVNITIVCYHTQMKFIKTKLGLVKPKSIFYLKAEYVKESGTISFLKKITLRSCDLDDAAYEVEGVLSPLDEDLLPNNDLNKLNIKQKSEEIQNTKTSTDIEEEPEVFVLEAPNNGEGSPTVEEETPLYNIIDHLELNIPVETDDNTSLDLEVDNNMGNVFNREDTGATEDSSPTNKRIEDEVFIAEEASPQREDKEKKFGLQCKVSDMSVDSIMWLSHRLGPVLTARYLSRNLLRMLTLCYLGKDNLTPSPSYDLENTHSLSITKGSLVGDQNSVKVLECLASIAALYGEHFILLQYLPHISELIALCKRKLTVNLEAGLVGALALLKHIVPYLCDSSLMDQLQDVILKNVLHPAVRLISTTKFMFPSGAIARTAVANKFVDVIYVIARRIGREMTRQFLIVPSLQRFFLTFDKAFERYGPEETGLAIRSTDSARDSPLRSLEDGSYLEIRRDGSVAEWAFKGSPMQISHVRVRDNDVADSFSPPVASNLEDDPSQNFLRHKALEELKEVFTPQLAHVAYLPLVLFLGDTMLQQSLKNDDFIQELCFRYEDEIQLVNSSSGGPVDVFYLSDYLGPNGQQEVNKEGTGSFGSNVAVVGNRIDLQRVDVPSVQHLSGSSSKGLETSSDVSSLISRKMDNTKRHLHGNWLAYWEHEIGRAEKDMRFNFKQIKLQTFSGHNNSVRAVHALNNENSFLSGSRDKTVKLWALRSLGNGSAVSHCQWTYTGHRKSVVAITFLDSLRLVASCDYGIHIWDPFMGSVVGTLESSRHPQVNVLKAMPAPSTSFLAATTDIVTLRLVDARICSYVTELKVSLNPVGYIRCIAVSPNGHWVAVGHSSGCLTVLDIRTGIIMASWKGHEGEVLQLVAVDDSKLISSSLDQTVSVWNVYDGKLYFHMKGPTEPVHCLSAYGTELISGTTANRIGVHTAIDAHASFSSTRLRADAFKGVLTTMAVLPLNRLLLLGADSGNISLLC